MLHASANYSMESRLARYPQFPPLY